MLILTAFRLIKLYKESVEETIKENVTIGGQAWDNVGESEASSSSLLQEGVCMRTWKFIFCTFEWSLF